MKKNLLLLFLIIPFLTNAQLEMDDFESYTVGTFDSQWDASEWVGWFGGNSGVEVSDELAASGANSLKVGETPSQDDLVALIPVLNSGIHEISFKQYIPAANGSYFNLQHNYTNTAGDWAMEVSFSDASISQGLITTDGADTPFDIVHDSWANILFILNFDAEEAQFFYNDNLVHTWVLSTNAGGGAGLNAINAINFFATCNGNCTSLAYYDDLVVEAGALPEFSVSLESEAMEAEYTNIPLSQTNALNLSAEVSNGGANDVSNVSVIARVFDENNNELYSESLGTVATLASGMSATLNSPATTFRPTAAGTFRVEYMATVDEIGDIVDGNSNNFSFTVSDSIYSRDDGVYFNGFGGDQPGIYGHLYEVVNTAEVSSINVTYAGTGVGEIVQGRIMSLSSGGNPVEIIAMTEEAEIREAGDIGAEASLSVTFSSPVELQPGRYAFMIEQKGNTSLAVSISNNIFTPNTSFLSQDDGQTWDVLEGVGPGFPVSMAIHPVFARVTVGVEEPEFAPSLALNPNITTGLTTLSLDLESKQDLLVEIYNMQGQRVYVQKIDNVSGNVMHKMDLSNQASGMYFVAISSDGKRTSRKLNLIK